MALPRIGGPHPRRGAIVARLFADNLARSPSGGESLKGVEDRAAGYGGAPRK